MSLMLEIIEKVFKVLKFVCCKCNRDFCIICKFYKYMFYFKKRLRRMKVLFDKFSSLLV